jgi:hypothetical protein
MRGLPVELTNRMLYPARRRPLFDLPFLDASDSKIQVVSDAPIHQNPLGQWRRLAKQKIGGFSDPEVQSKFSSQ